IRDATVTGVQTCALPISRRRNERVDDSAEQRGRAVEPVGLNLDAGFSQQRAGRVLCPQGRGGSQNDREVAGEPLHTPRTYSPARSEERRGGKVWRSGW